MTLSVGGSPSRESKPTTIKVSSATRDRLKQLARSEACTIDDYLNKLIALAYREQRWDALRASVEQMTPDERADYFRETDDYQPDPTWDGISVDDEWQSEWDRASFR